MRLPGPAKFADDSVTFSWEPSISIGRSGPPSCPIPSPGRSGSPSSRSTTTSSSRPTSSRDVCPPHWPRTAPRVVEQDDGTQAWVFEGNRYPNVGLNAVVGRPRDEWSMEPARFDEMRPGCFDIEARMEDMDRAGIWAALCFPSLVSGFCGAGLLAGAGSRTRTGLPARLQRLAPRGMGWTPPRSHHPPAAALADRTLPLAADEVRANAARGFKAVSFPEFPAQLGLPSIFSGSGIPSSPPARRPTPSSACTRDRPPGPPSRRPTRPSRSSPPSSRSTRCWPPANGCGRASPCASRSSRWPCPKAASAGCPC